MKAAAVLSACTMVWSSLLLLPLGVSLSIQSPLLSERQSATINVPATVPNTASDVVDHGYPGFAISGHSFQEYAGNISVPNIFSRNLIQTISDRTGAPVQIRVGGTSADFAVYDPNQRTALTLPSNAVPGGIPKGMRLGTAWFEGFASFPGVQWTYMVKLANFSAKQNAVAGAREAMKYIGDNLEALEVGNEIDFYPNVNRPGTYNPVAYLKEWNEYKDALTTAIGMKKYQAPVYYGNNCPWCIANTFEKGQGDATTIRSAALHHYMESTNNPSITLQKNYMNHTRIAQKLDPYKAPVAWLKTNRPRIPIYLAEVNSNTFSSDNEATLGVFGSALWLVDYMLYGMTLNFKRMNVQQSTGFAYTSWRGVEYFGKPAAVLPPYYAHPFVADVIGNSGDIRIADLKLGQDLLSAYAIYNSAGRITKIVLINLQEWSASSNTIRPSRTVNFKAGTYSGNVKVEKLTAAGGANVQDASKISWKGDSWTFQSNGRPVKTASTTQTIRASNGVMTTTVRASEALLLTLA
ncbi:uncharacterized protein RCC_06954 [Ramularia collo-cygni]|uniref:Beta-glucuronidase C-terminal domain-containing protein n=1 Tax=Ramularia collo-cygni TaxID=112498 RepID=A0A2D3VJI2_9PEZI|nr:uncharacterized protein RCC_06954 [Ramularia collo-cygni]CZT21093.1 uncharacterized protein RCC_06954 [Ramularia collo-cygni]